ncbi:MAG: ParB/RepB/Spo0J family partition protein [Methanobacterium sp.]
MKIEDIRLDLIDINFNVRTDDLERDLDELVNSIEKIGLQQPVTVFRKNNRYQLIIGQRRFLAVKKLNWETIPAIITEVKDDTDAIIKSFSENIHRLDLTYSDKNRVAKKLFDKYQDIGQVATALGVQPQTVRNYLGWDLVPESVQDMAIKDKSINTRDAIRISRTISDPDKIFEIASLIAKANRSEDKIKIIETAKENPEKSIDEIKNLANKIKKKIVLYLTDRTATALKLASEKFNSTDENIAIDAIEQWLNNQGLLK